jgi:hypothetical protein
MVADHTEYVLHSMLEKAAAGGAGRTPNEQKIGDSYAACMDVAKASATAQAIFSVMAPPGDCAVRSGTIPMFGHGDVGVPASSHTCCADFNDALNLEIALLPRRISE